ncbi:MAG: hypothetical protein KQH83_11355 [Actinobacteria bacterium]|nr:hypothetical protein [Actinomycetota bacterium]
MDTRTLITKLEAALEQQLLVGGGQPEVEAAAAALLGLLGPALREGAMELAEQAAAEVAGQLPGHEIEIVVVDGDPEFRVRSTGGEDTVVITGEPFDARITLRLPPQLKSLIEDSADAKGESVNSWLVRSLSSATSKGSKKSSRTVAGRIQT